MVDGTKLPIHGKSTLQLQIGALRWKPTLPITNIKGLDFILGRDFLKRFNPEIDWVNRKTCIYNNMKRVELRSWTDTGSVPETTLARRTSSTHPRARDRGGTRCETRLTCTIPTESDRTNRHEEVDRVSTGQTTDPPIHLSLRCTSSLHSKARRLFTDVHRLPRTEQTDSTDYSASTHPTGSRQRLRGGSRR
ncbi:unnamed protein product [Closterium sp. NIES-54]